MSAVVGWKHFDADFIWLKFTNEGGIRLGGGRRAPDAKWRLHLAAAMFKLAMNCKPRAALGMFSATSPSGADLNSVVRAAELVRKQEGWEAVVRRGPAPTMTPTGAARPLAHQPRPPTGPGSIGYSDALPKTRKRRAVTQEPPRKSEQVKILHLPLDLMMLELDARPEPTILGRLEATTTATPLGTADAAVGCAPTGEGKKRKSNVVEAAASSDAARDAQMHDLTTPLGRLAETLPNKEVMETWLGRLAEALPNKEVLETWQGRSVEAAHVPGSATTKIDALNNDVNEALVAPLPEAARAVMAAFVKAFVLNASGRIGVYKQAVKTPPHAHIMGVVNVLLCAAQHSNNHHTSTLHSQIDCPCMLQGRDKDMALLATRRAHAARGHDRPVEGPGDLHHRAARCGTHTHDRQPTATSPPPLTARRRERRQEPTSCTSPPGGTTR